METNLIKNKDYRFLFNEVTGIYEGTCRIEGNGLEDAVWPKNCTHIEPSFHIKHKTVWDFNTGNWKFVDREEFFRLWKTYEPSIDDARKIMDFMHSYHFEVLSEISEKHSSMRHALDYKIERMYLDLVAKDQARSEQLTRIEKSVNDFYLENNQRLFSIEAKVVHTKEFARLTESRTDNMFFNFMKWLSDLFA